MMPCVLPTSAVFMFLYMCVRECVCVCVCVCVCERERERETDRQRDRGQTKGECAWKNVFKQNVLFYPSSSTG
jgi:hypothetical protein